MHEIIFVKHTQILAKNFAKQDATAQQHRMRQQVAFAVSSAASATSSMKVSSSSFTSFDSLAVLISKGS